MERLLISLHASRIRADAFYVHGSQRIYVLQTEVVAEHFLDLAKIVRFFQGPSPGGGGNLTC